jgi:hypothetical protein
VLIESMGDRIKYIKGYQDTTGTLGYVTQLNGTGTIRGHHDTPPHVT